MITINRKLLIAAFIIGLLIGALGGYMWGVDSTMTWVSQKMIHFLYINGIKVDVNAGELKLALEKYKDNIDNCYPTEIYNDKNKTNS